MLSVRRILILKDVPLFKDMSAAVLSGLANIADEQVFAKSQKVFEKGDEGSSLFIIIEGSIRIHDANDVNKPNKTLATLKEGDFFGELSLLGNEKRSASATAVNDSILLEISQDSFQHLLMENFDLSKNLLSSLADRIRELTQKLQN